MTGPRLIVGVIVMGVFLPLILFFLLDLRTLTEMFILSMSCFLTWGVADLVTSIISRPRLLDRSPSDALKSLDLTEKQARQREREGGTGDPTSN